MLSYMLCRPASLVVSTAGSMTSSVTKSEEFPTEGDVRTPREASNDVANEREMFSMVQVGTVAIIGETFTATMSTLFSLNLLKFETTFVFQRRGKVKAVKMHISVTI